MDIFSMYGEDEILAREYLFQPYQLIDLHRMSDDEIREQKLSGLMEFALKYRNVRRNISEFFDNLFIWVKEIDKDPNGSFLGRIVLHYVLDILGWSNYEIFKKKAEQHLTSDLKGEVMKTIADIFRDEGFKQGIKQGIEQGIEQGKEEGLLSGAKNLFLSLMQNKYGVIPIEYIKTIEKADYNTIKLWTENLINSNSVYEIFNKVEKLDKVS